MTLDFLGELILSPESPINGIRGKHYVSCYLVLHTAGLHMLRHYRKLDILAYLHNVLRSAKSKLLAKHYIKYRCG